MRNRSLQKMMRLDALKALLLLVPEPESKTSPYALLRAILCYAYWKNAPSDAPKTIGLGLKMAFTTSTFFNRRAPWLYAVVSLYGPLIRRNMIVGCKN